MDKELIETVSDGVATLTLNRPDRLNALSAPIMEALLEAVPRLAGDSSIGAIVLTGAGRAFCAGGDVKRMAAETVAAQQRGGRRPAAQPDGNLAAAARDSQAHHRDGERAGGGRRTFHGARLRHAHRRSVGALRHGIREGRLLRRLRRELLPLQAGRHRQSARTLLHGGAARCRAGAVAGHRQPGRAGRRARRCHDGVRAEIAQKDRASRSA